MSLLMACWSTSHDRNLMTVASAWTLGDIEIAWVMLGNVMESTGGDDKYSETIGRASAVLIMHGDVMAVHENR